MEHCSTSQVRPFPPLQSIKLTPWKSYLGDALVHFSIPLLLFADAHFHPLTLLGPLTNYLFLRHIGGDKENESSQLKRYAESNPEKLEQLQEYRREKNAFWPAMRDLVGTWSVGLVGLGVGVALVERFVRTSRVV